MTGHEQRLVKDWHLAMDIPYTNTVPHIPEDAELRLELIREELSELYQAVREENVVEVADALADLLFVVYGAGLAAGMDLEPIFEEICRSNFTKVGGPRREDGKMLKPEWYEPPVLAPILERQGWKR